MDIKDALFKYYVNWVFNSMLYPNIMLIGYLIPVISNLNNNFVNREVYGFIWKNFLNIGILKRKRFLPIWQSHVHVYKKEIYKLDLGEINLSKCLKNISSRIKS